VLYSSTKLTPWNRVLLERLIVIQLVKKFFAIYEAEKSRDSLVGIALDYGLDDWDSRVRVPEGAANFSLHHRVQNGSGAHPASYPMVTRVSFPGGKTVGA
jgi:hypothetical protein